jgi:hypothetical protein
MEHGERIYHKYDSDIFMTVFICSWPYGYGMLNHPGKYIHSCVNDVHVKCKYIHIGLARNGNRRYTTEWMYYRAHTTSR